MTKTTQALGGADLDSLLLEGEKLSSDVRAAVIGLDVERTIDGASTLTMTLRDHPRTLIRSGLFDARVRTQIDQYSFELVQITKQGDDVTATFEALAIAALRKHDSPRKVAAGTMTRVDFARSLVREEPWIRFQAPVVGERTKVELARGTVADEDTKPEHEDTWSALGRLADDVGWRRYSVETDEIWFVPEETLIAHDAAYVVSEFTAGVDYIDFDFDIGKPVAKASLFVRASLWDVAPGQVVEVTDLGPASGKWLVASIRRPLLTTGATVELSKARPTLPEPDAPKETDGDTIAGFDEELVVPGAAAGVPSGLPTSPSTAGPDGYISPMAGRISSPYGPRNGRLHAGIDIANVVGTPVYATKAGTVQFVGNKDPRGYGNSIEINHGSGVMSRYAHLSQMLVTNGQAVSRGQQIAKSGGARGASGSGSSTGPHLHFEIRVGGEPRDPLSFLTNRDHRRSGAR